MLCDTVLNKDHPEEWTIGELFIIIGRCPNVKSLGIHIPIIHEGNQALRQAYSKEFVAMTISLLTLISNFRELRHFEWGSDLNTSTPSTQRFYFLEQSVSTLNKRLPMIKSISASHISKSSEKKICGIQPVAAWNT
ncbi:hypothetical protein CROQUDRAFT_243296 [Cronartium quercuum f. sp. fusiforme G11]|uniref:Uncharacterized protein n=1 Tax=Cronartium quercuum f. sp. fusiforme G11 TaxID=708437 RepID=A0A9P6T856_9BASI|nr:hypothetical protein CROQUDRAFT_243296 [Cronartium quercuum f. sp. fusiforme G11]